MLNAGIHGIECPDLSEFRTWVPNSPAEVFVPLMLYIGTDDSQGVDRFDIVIATSEAMQGKSRQEFSRILIVREYRWSETEATLISWVERVMGVSWAQIADDLRKRFYWEYEGMGSPYLRDPAP